MSSLDRKHKAGRGELALLLFLVVLMFGVPAALYAITSFGDTLLPRPEPMPEGFWERALATITGAISWRPVETWIAAGLGVLLAAVLGFYLRGRAKTATKRVRHDRAAIRMASAAEVKPFIEKEARSKAAGFGVESPGIFVGRMVRGAKGLYASWEDTLLHIWGSRTGKTTTQAAPAIADAPGPVIATSNKRDLSDLTREFRSEQGSVWVFDPQGVANEDPQWWWNPLTYVTDGERAAEMATNFALGSRSAGAQAGDAYFDSAGKDLLAGFLLAAAVGGEPIERVHTWLSRPTEDRPIKLLDEAGWAKEADSVGGAINAPDKQREGIYGTARQMASCLKNEKIAKWVNPTGPGDRRPQFDPETFVRGKNTLYALSKEGAGTAGPLVTALTVATVTAAEEYAVAQPAGRLRVPMLCVLDEAANVCRWSNLPDLYSHYGSRGIVVSTFLQSWSQGVDVWGESGMKKLFSTANVVTYGGNVKEEQFLKMLSELIGQYRYTSVSTSRQKDSNSVSRQDASEEILSVADLASLPKGRAVMIGSGAKAVLVRTIPLHERPQGQKTKASTKKQKQPEAGTAVVTTTDARPNRWARVVDR